MMKLPDGRKPFYEDPVGIAFVQNHDDWPDGYDVFIGRDENPDKRRYVCLPSRCLHELTRPGISAVQVVDKMDNATNGRTSLALQEAGVEYSQFHTALLQLKIKQLEKIGDMLAEEARELTIYTSDD